MEHRHLKVKRLNLSIGVRPGRIDAVGNGGCTPVVGAKAVGGLIALDSRGEEDAAGVAKDGILQGPIQHLLDVLETILFEPRAKSAVSEDEVGNGSAPRGGANSNIGKNPQAVHDNAVKTGSVVMQPVPKPWGKAIAPEPALAEGVNRAGETPEPWSAGRILAENLHRVACLSIDFRELANGFGRAAIGRGETANYMKDAHRLSLKTSIFKEIKVLQTRRGVGKTRCAHGRTQFLMIPANESPGERVQGSRSVVVMLGVEGASITPIKR